MLGPRLHSRRRYHPQTGVQVHLGPSRAPRFTAPRASQYQETKAEADGAYRLDALPCVRRVLIGKGGVMPDGWPGAGQRPIDSVTGDVVLDELIRLRPSQHSPDALPHAAGLIGRGGPKRLQRGQHVGSRDAVNAERAKAREGVPV